MAFFLQAIWSHLFSKKSSIEKGTLYQLKNLLHRTGVPNDPGDNMKAAEDFLLVVLHSHVIAAAKTILSSTFTSGVNELSRSIVNHYVHLTVPSQETEDFSCSDKVTLYAMQVLTLRLLWQNFHDSVKEGDGSCIIRCWKFNLLVFKASNRKKYSIEALNLLLLVNFLLSP